MGEAETRPLLASYGMRIIPGKVVKTAQDAAAVAQELGYPVAVKVVSPQILHKSDLGGIRLHLDSELAVIEAIEKMSISIKQTKPQAEIRGFLVEKMAPEGMEVIVGMRRDPAFGPLMMFGLGGVTVELYKDVGFGVAPMTREQAMEMIHMSKAGTLLEGYRGGEVFDINAVIDVIGRLSRFALDHPQITEVEINPLLVLPENQGAVILDARAILSN